MIGVAIAFTLLAALHHRARTGEGQYIDMAMAETVTSMIPEAVLEYTMNGREPTRMGNRSKSDAPQGVYRCSGDDQWVAITVGDDEQWRAMRKALGNPAWAEDKQLADSPGRLQNQDLLDKHITEWTKQHTHYEVMHKLQAVGVAAAPCLGVRELAEDPQIQALGWVVEMDHKEVGRRKVAGLPARLSAIPEFAYGPAPLFGEHTEEVLCGLLGMSKDEIDRLAAEQVVF